MPDERFAEHLTHPFKRGNEPVGGHRGAAGGAACGDLARIDLAVVGDRVADGGFEASGCGATTAACSAALALAVGATPIDAARIGTHAIAAELGGLSPGKIHAAELAADALHGALGRAAAADAVFEPRPGRTLVAMSGGVDSAVAALLAMRGQDREAVAVTLELWRDPENDAERSCCSASAVRVARSMAHAMGMPHFTLDLREEFRAGVVDPWLAGHAAGETPNPCIACNGSVRLDAMVAFADRLGAESLATGHYARTGNDGLLAAAVDDGKDQTYMLAGLAPETLAMLRFPLGELRKERVREIARENGLEAADRPDSQDLCFLAGTGRRRFLERHGRITPRSGEIVDRSGTVLGSHPGAESFTVGQRRGLQIGGSAAPLYVVSTDVTTNRVTVGPREELATDRVRLRDLALHVSPDQIDAVKLRYRHPAVPCRLNGSTLELAAPFSGSAPGQTAVLLRGDSVAGSATIDR